MPSTNLPGPRDLPGPPDRKDPSDLSQRRLLQSVVEVARDVYGAAAASVFLVHEETGDLVFEAVAGEGEDHLLGTRFPAGTGIAGWTVMCGQSLLVDDVAENPQFARDAAESTGYVPRSIMAAPLFYDGDCIGVLEVLDRDARPRSDRGDLDALGLLATETAAMLELLVRVRTLEAGRDAGREGPDVPDVLRRVADRLPNAPDHVGATVAKLLQMADELLAEVPVSAGTAGAGG
ncbi:MAG: GAF domain-containing protein [Catenulispora sp.]|nr:GAF domain-containing protein [Catenulispora sp.]